MIQFACGKCGIQVSVSDEMAGRSGRCPKCGTVMRIPAASQPVSAPPPAPLPAPRAPVTVPTKPFQTPVGPARPARRRRVIVALIGVVFGAAAVLATLYGIGRLGEPQPAPHEQTAQPTPTGGAGAVPAAGGTGVVPAAGRADPRTETPALKPIDASKPPLIVTAGDAASPVKLTRATAVMSSLQVSGYNSVATCPRLDFELLIKNTTAQPVDLGGTMMMFDVADSGKVCIGRGICATHEGRPEVPDAERTHVEFLQRRYGLAGVYDCGRSGTTFTIFRAGASVFFTSVSATDKRDGAGLGRVPPGGERTIHASFLLPRTVRSRGRVVFCGPLIHTPQGAWRVLLTFGAAGEKLPLARAELVPSSPAVLAKLAAEDGRHIGDQMPLLNWLAETRSAAGIERFHAVLKEQVSGSALRVIALYGLGMAGDTASVDLLIKTVSDYKATPQERTAGMAALGYLGDGRGLATARAAMGGRNAAMRETAAWSYARLKGPRPIAPLIERLGDRSSSVRDEAIRSLRLLGDPAALPPVIDELSSGTAARHALADWGDRVAAASALRTALRGHPSPAVRARCVELLGERKTDEARAAVLAALSDRRAKVRTAALAALADCGRSGDAERVAGMLQDRSDAIRTAAIRTLGALKAPGTVRRLAPLTAAPSRPERIAALSALGKLGDPKGVDAAKRCLGDGNTDVQKAALSALADLGHVSTDPACFIDRLSNYQTRTVAEKALKDCPDRAGVVAALIRAVKSHSSKDVRGQCIALLGELKAPSGNDALLAALGGSDKTVRIAAARALGKLGERRAAGALQKAAADADESVRAAAVDALVALKRCDDPSLFIDPLASYRTRSSARKALEQCPDTSRMTAAVAKALREHKTASVRRECASILGATKAPGGYDALVAALGDSDDGVRTGVLSALAALGDRRCVPVVLKLAGDKNASVRRQAFETLAALGHAGTVDVYIDALGEYATSRTARKALKAMGDTGAVVGALTRAVRGHKEPAVRRAAAEMLGEMKATAGYDALRAATADKDASLRRAAIVAIGQLGDARGIDGLRQIAAKDGDPLRATAVSALGKIKAFKDTAFFVTLLKDKDSDVKGAAAAAILAGPRADGFAALLDGLDDYRIRSCLKTSENRTAILLAVAAGVTGHKDPKVRKHCADLLKEFASERVAAAVFAKALGDADPDVRRVALAGVGEVGDPDHLAGVLKCLGDPSSSVRAAAARAAVEFDCFTDPAPLMPLLRDKDSSPRAAAMHALGRIADVGTITPLIDAMGVKDSASEAEKALKNYHRTAALVAAAAAALRKHGDAAVRARCADLLGTLKAYEAQATLSAAVKDTDAKVRAKAVEVLAGLDSATCAAGISAALSDADATVRKAAATALGKLEDPRSVAPLTAAVDDKDAAVSTAALQALAAIGDPSCAAAVRRCLGPKDKRRKEALATLAALRQFDDLTVFIDALDDSSTRSMANRALQDVTDTKRLIPMLVGALGTHKSSSVRAACAGLLGDHKAVSALPALRKASTDKNYSVSSAAKRAVTKIEGR